MDHTHRRAVTFVLATLAFVGLALGPVPSHADSGDAGSLVVRGAGVHSGEYPIRQVAVDARGRIWFSSADRITPTGRRNGRVGHFTPGSPRSLRFFRHELMARPGKLARRGAEMWVADKSKHSLFRISGDVVTHFPVYDYGGGSIVRSPDSLLSRGRYIWFTARDGRVDEQIGLIARFDPSDPRATFQAWRVPGLQDLQGLAIGPDDRLWVVANGFTRPCPGDPDLDCDVGIGWARLNPDAANPGATLRRFPVQDGAHYVSNPQELVRGPDNRMWFIANGTSQVARINPFAPNPAATVEHFGSLCDGFSPPPCGGHIFDLIVGPDQAIWYTRSTANALGRVTTQGVVSTVTPPTPFNQPLGITRRAERLWMASGGNSRLAWYEP
jgi:streptogramin lyase